MKTENYIQKKSRVKRKTSKEYTALGMADCILPGKWKTIEVEICAQTSRTSYAMATKLHPSATIYEDFWGNINPYGEGCHQVFCTLVENDPGYNEKYRWVVTTGRYTHSDMSTNKFKYLGNAMKFMVKEMEKTTIKFDKILGEKTQMWDIDAIEKHNIFWEVPGNTEKITLSTPDKSDIKIKC